MCERNNRTQSKTCVAFFVLQHNAAIQLDSKLGNGLIITFTACARYLNKQIKKKNKEDNLENKVINMFGTGYC